MSQQQEFQLSLKQVKLIEALINAGKTHLLAHLKFPQYSEFTNQSIFAYLEETNQQCLIPTLHQMIGEKS